MALYLKEKLDIIQKIRDKWESDKDIWDSGLLGTQITDIEVPLDPGAEFRPGFPRQVTDSNSFIYQVTENNISMASITPLSVDSANSDPTGETDSKKSEVQLWYYYKFDWRGYQNIVGDDVEDYDFNGVLTDYFKKLALASIPYAVRLWGKKFKPDVNQEEWYNKYVQFGDFDVKSRVDPSTDLKDKEHLSQVNPGLTFLFGMAQKGFSELIDDDTVEIDMADLAPENAIIVRLDSIDKEFNKIARTLKIYHGIRKEMETPFDIEPIECDFEKEADLIKEVGSAVKKLLKDSAEKGGGVSSGVLGDQPEHKTSSQLEAFFKYPELWNDPKNIIEIGITNKWEVAYVREYAPVGTFRKNLSTASGWDAVETLGKIQQARIIGGGYSKSQKQMFASFKQQEGVRDPRTVAFVSRMHGSNGFNDGLKTEYNSNPQTGIPNQPILDFIKKVILPDGSTVSWKSEDPKAWQKATEVYLKKHGGSVATPRQRAQAGARLNNPSWAAQYEQYSKNWIINKTDQFFASLPQTKERLRINEGSPYILDALYTDVLSRADVKRLTAEVIKCWLDPNSWLELACRYAMKELGVDAWFEQMQKDGTMDKLKQSAEIGNQISDSFNTIASEKRVTQATFDRLDTERNKYNNQGLELLTKRKAIEADLNVATDSEDKKRLRQEIESINFELKVAVGRRRQVEMDSGIASVNRATGAWVPMTPEGASRAAKSAQNISNAIMDISDPNFKKELCANIISYSLKAAQMLYDLYRVTAEYFKDDPNKEDGNDSLKQENRPKAQTDDIGLYFVEAVRAIAAQALATTVLFFVRKLLTELVEACQKLKSSLWDDINKEDSRKNDKIPGKARYNDLLAQTPSKAARDLTAKLSGFIDIADEDITTDLLGLMEDLELLLSQLEICALSRGTATVEVLTIIKNLLQIRYNKLYLNLKGEDKSLSFARIKSFFINFEPLIKTEYCEELQKSDKPLQIYQECPPYIQTLCGDLLIGHCTNEQIDNICKRAKIDRLDALLDLIDIAYNPERTNIPDPADPRSPNAVPQDMYPNNIINDMLADQNLRPAASAFKSEMFAFSNKLFHEGTAGFPAVTDDDAGKVAKRHANAAEGPDGAKPWSGSPGDDTANLVQPPKEKTLLKPIQNSLISPLKWEPEPGTTSLSSFNLPQSFTAGWWINWQLVGDETSQIIRLGRFGDNPKWIKGQLTYPMREGKVTFLPVARFDSFLNIYGTTAPKVKNGILELTSFKDNSGWAQGPLDDHFEDLFSSLSAEEFYDKVNSMWPEWSGNSNSSLEGSEKGLKFIFNLLVKNIGNRIFSKVYESILFTPEGKETLESFFNNFFPQLAFNADQSCDVKEVSLLKVNSVKKYIQDRNNDLEKELHQPNLNEETPNLARAQAEGAVMTLMRVYAFETALRLLPMLPIIRIKDMLTSEIIINVLLEHILYELAMLDYKKVRKTLSSKNAKDLRNTKPVKGNQLDPSGGRLEYTQSPSGEGRFVEEPPCPATAAENGKAFEPKFQAHVVYYANNIMKGRVAKKVEEGEVLFDPITKEEYTHSVDYSTGMPIDINPYSLSGISYLLKEQMAEISDFLEREFNFQKIPLSSGGTTEVDIKSFEHFFLESFLYKDMLAKDNALGGHIVHNEGLAIGDIPWQSTQPMAKQMLGPKSDFFDLMPSINNLSDNWPTEWNISYPEYIKSIFDDYSGTDKEDKVYKTDISKELDQGGLESNLNSHIIMNPRFYELGLVSSYWQNEEVVNLIEKAKELASTIIYNSGQNINDAGEWVEVEVDVNNTLHVDALQSIINKLKELGVVITAPPEIVVKEGKEASKFAFIYNAAWITPPGLSEELKNFLPEGTAPPAGQVLYVLTNFAREAGFEEGGFILEPYIRVKQHTPFEETDYFEADPQIKQALAEKAYKDKFDEYTDNKTSLQDAMIWEKCNDGGAGGATNAEYNACSQAIIDNWHSTTQIAAQQAYNNVVDTPFKLQFDKHLGDFWKPKGAYINIAHWSNSMSGKGSTTSESLDPLKLNLNPEGAKRPHTDWFDQWMYGLRLVYVLPLKTNTTDSFSTDNELYEIPRDEVLTAFNDYIGVEHINANDPWDILNKKAYILHERINLATIGQNKLYYELLQQKKIEELPDLSREMVSGLVGPPIFSVPMLEVEVPVGSVTYDEKLYAKQIVYSEAYNDAIANGKSPDEAANEAEIASNDFFEKINSSVPLNYFTFQNWNNRSDYPLEQLLCAMMKNKEFDFFTKIFPLENYKALLGLYLLLQTFEMNEYQGEYSSLFAQTKGQLRHIFYSNTLAHDRNTNIPIDKSENVQAQQNEEAPEDWWANLGELLLGTPPNYAKIFAMTPIGVLKAMVTVTDPSWKNVPWTVPGIIMHLLQNKAGALSGPWFSSDQDAKPSQKALVPCPEQFSAKSSIDFTQDELDFIEMMKSYGLGLEDRNFILLTPYRLPTILEGGKAINEESNVDFSQDHYFSESALFKVLLSAWKNKKSEELQKISVIFNNLREYYDASLVLFQSFNDHSKNYMNHAYKVYEEYYKPAGAWIVGTDFEETLFINCNEIDDLRYNGYNDVNDVCANNFMFEKVKQQVNALELLFNTILSQIELNLPQNSLELMGPTDMVLIDESDEKVPLLSNTISPIDQEKLFPYGTSLNEDQVIELINNEDSLSYAIPSYLISEKQLAYKISHILTNLVGHNKKLFEFKGSGINAAWQGLVMSPLTHENWSTAKKTINFNSVDGHDLRTFWLMGNDWDELIKGPGNGKPMWHFQLGSVHPNAKPHSADFMMKHLFKAEEYTNYPTNKLNSFVNLYNLTKESFSYSNNLVGFHLDALTKDPTHSNDLLFSYYDDFDSYTKDKMNYPTDKTIQDVIQHTQEGYEISFYDMYNLGHHLDIGKYWTESWFSPLVVKNRKDVPEVYFGGGPGKKPGFYLELGEHTPEFYWEFADLEHEYFSYAGDITDDAFLKYQPGYSNAIDKSGLVLDHVAWYYPKLAAVIAEMMYKLYNIALRTTCIEVFESKVPEAGDLWHAEINIKSMRSNESFYYGYPLLKSQSQPKPHEGFSYDVQTDYKTYGAEYTSQPKVAPYPLVKLIVNKKATRKDLIDREFIF